MATVDEQLKALARGVQAIVPMDEFKAKLEKSAKTGVPLRIKLGIDPTASDIHLGFAVVLRKLRQFQDFGHTIDLVIGDFTAMIGDPTGRSLTRPQLTDEQITAHAITYEHQLYKILDPAKTKVHRNSDWLGKITFAQLIEITGKFTVAQILEREDFSNRMASGQPLYLHEILYPVAQALDSVDLVSDVEIGGQDQTFNIMAGRDLLREYGHEPQIGLFMPILVGLDGEKKMSKSLGNYIGIFESPAEQFGKTMSIPDAALEQWFELCTDVPLEEVKPLIAENPMAAKKRLGREIVALYHSTEDADHAQAAWEHQFSQREVPDDMPEFEVTLEENGTIWVVNLLKAAELAKGTNDARRTIQQGGFQLNGEKVTDIEARVAAKTGDVLKVGRRYAKISVQ
ncbi:MAG TPA: tyrosine--tRNA ligase [Armatimonadota bacterium]|jgi:tyrosyl-tRNA synthetase